MGHLGSSVADQASWDLVKNNNFTSVLQLYLDKFPNGKDATVARKEIKKIGKNAQIRGSEIIYIDEQGRNKKVNLYKASYALVTGASRSRLN